MQNFIPPLFILRFLGEGDIIKCDRGTVLLSHKM